MPIGLNFQRKHPRLGYRVKYLYYSFARRDVLSKSNVLEKDKKSRGQKYLAKMILLSRCRYLITSITQGSKFSYAQCKELSGR